jgi:hypothetical protein
MRNAYHILIGFTLMYLIGSLTNFSEFTTYSKIVGVPLISLIVGSAIGFVWEWLQSLRNPLIFDLNDIIRTAIGSFLGGLFSLWMPNILWLILVSCSVSLFLIIKDLKK